MRRLAIVAVALLLASCDTPPPQSSDEYQITRDVGLAQFPVLSRDASVIAFSAPSNGAKNPQIWVRRADQTFPAQRLTGDSSQNYDPEFSPDGAFVYFTSDRAPEGIYRVPVSGGTPEMVIEGAIAAKISPDGKTLLYGMEGKVFERALEGGPAREVLPGIENSYAPVWSPDSARILVSSANVSAGNGDARQVEWWIAPAAGGDAHRTSIVASLREQGFNSAVANAWLPGDWIVFTGLQGETQTLWKIQLSGGGEATGKAMRATDDAQGDYAASFAAGKLAFARTRVDMNFWALPLDPTGERVSGQLEQLTSSPGQKGQQSIAGSRLLYSAENGDRFSLILKTGKAEKILRDGFFSVLSPDGASYAYGDGTKERQNVYIKSVSWWPFWSTKLCENCTMPRGFSADGKKMLLWADSPPVHHLDMLDVASGQLNRVVWSNDDLSGPRLSPDGRWVSFVAKMGKHEWQTFVAPVSPEKLLNSFEWTPIAPVSDSFHFAFWSEKGDIIYILTAQGGSGNLKWLQAQRVDPQSKTPIGGPIPVYEFDEMLVPGMDPIWNTPTVSGGRIVLELGKVSTDIWVRMEPAK